MHNSLRIIKLDFSWTLLWAFSNGMSVDQTLFSSISSWNIWNRSDCQYSEKKIKKHRMLKIWGYFVIFITTKNCNVIFTSRQRSRYDKWTEMTSLIVGPGQAVPSDFVWEGDHLSTASLRDGRTVHTWPFFFCPNLMILNKLHFNALIPSVTRPNALRLTAPGIFMMKFRVVKQLCFCINPFITTYPYSVNTWVLPKHQCSAEQNQLCSSVAVISQSLIFSWL